MENGKQNEEIDLLDLIVKSVILIKQNFVQILIFFLTGAAIGFAYSSLAPKSYESKMMVSSDILTESYSEKIIENVGGLLKEKNLAVLASRLQMSEEEADKISRVQIQSAMNDKPQKEEEKRFFTITATVSDPEILPNLEKGIVHFFADNDFVKVRVEQKKSYYNRLILKVSAEIESLEAFKNKIYQGGFLESKTNLVFDPTAVNSKIIELTKEKLTFENSLQLVNSVQIVEGFVKFNRPVWPRRSVSLLVGAGLGLFLVVILIAFKSIRKLVRFAEDYSKD